MDRYKKFMYISIIVLILSVVGATYAYYQKVLFNDLGVNTSTKGLDYYINYTKGQDIVSGVLNPGSNYTSGSFTSVVLYKKDNTYEIYGHIYLDITTIGTNISNSKAVKYTLLDNDGDIMAEGNLNNKVSSSSVPLALNIPLKTTSETYTLYLWIDENENLNNNMENEALSAKIRCEATMKPILYGAAKTISDLYTNASKTIVTNNNIQYNTAPSVGLMNDRLGGTIGLDKGNIRYYGANPNNYAYFNCETYPSTNCELWRIVGVFDGKLKLIRNSSIGQYAWDNKNISTGAETNDGKNDWTDATLMKLLNPGYNSMSIGGSLYYNSGSGNCYVGQNNATRSCNFTSSGLKNSFTRNMISKTKYYLGGYNASVYSDVMYQYERGNTVYNGRSTFWIGRVAIPYPSDYGYASDLSQCNQKLYNYDATGCLSSNYIGTIISGNYGRLLTPTSDSSSKVMRVSTTGNLLYSTESYNSCGITPVLYLNSTITINGGTGIVGNPYKLNM